MMDLKEIIKWFIPCFHILRLFFKTMNCKLTVVCIIVFYIGCANAYSVRMGNHTKKLDSSMDKLNQSDLVTSRMFGYSSIGRTFGRPFKKMMAALLPLVFQIGAASTWAVVAALVGIKTLAVTLIILKLLLMAGAAKFGALVGSHKGHYKESWEPHQHHPQKEIHVHIHNGGHHEVQDEHQIVYGAGPWSREDGTSASQKVNNIEPYFIGGPQTIKTPFGNYMKIESADPLIGSTGR